MKKFILLTSALALAACGGGGGSNVVSGPSASYVAPRPAVAAAVATSNAQITSMPSEVVVASNSTTPVSVVGVGTSVISGGVTYTSYRLDDVKLFTAENLDTTGHSYVNLELNDDTGEIDAVKMKVGGADSGRNEREKNTDGSFKDTFAGPIFEYVLAGDDQAVFRVVDNGQDMDALEGLETANSLSGGYWNRVDERMAFKSYGGEEGLQYSDFGHFNPVYKSKNTKLTSDADILGARTGVTRVSADPDVEDKYRDDAEFAAKLAKEDYQLFAGGYAIDGTTMVDTLVPDNGAIYEGKAIGRVYTSIKSTGANRDAYLASWNVEHDLPGAYSDDAGHDMAKAYTTSQARMTIGPGGSQTLEMPFYTHSDTADKFYDVTITQATPGDTPDFAFTGADMATSVYRRNDTEGSLKKDFTPGYYGVNTPVEAAGTAFYRTKQVDVDGSREWEFEAAYGMKKQ